MRLVAGKHFPADILFGSGMGFLAVILVPQFHKYKTNRPLLNLLPLIQGKLTVDVNCPTKT
jgi:membrane-associated phospholipid phosphatase